MSHLSISYEEWKKPHWTIPQSLGLCGFGAIAAFALRISVPGGILYGVTYKASTYAGIVFGALGRKVFNLEMPIVLTVYVSKVIVAGAIASTLFPLSTVAALTSMALAVDILGVLLLDTAPLL